MKLLPYEIEKKIPRDPDKKMNVYIKFFTPWTNMTWYVLSMKRYEEDVIFYGLVNLGNPDFAEYGEFSLKELESINGPYGLKIERDLYWTIKPIYSIV